MRSGRVEAAPDGADGDRGFAPGAWLAVGRAGHHEAGGAHRAVEAAFEVAEVSAWHRAQQRGLDAQREIAVRGAGLAQALEGVSRAAQTFADPAVPFAVAAAGGALGIERLADGVPFADHGNELVAESLLRRVRLGLAVLALPEQGGGT